MIMLLCSNTLLRAIHSLTTHSLVEIYLMAVELGTINTSKEPTNQ